MKYMKRFNYKDELMIFCAAKQRRSNVRLTSEARPGTKWRVGAMRAG